MWLIEELEDCFILSAIDDLELSMEDIKLKAEKWGLDIDQNLPDLIDEHRANDAEEASKERFVDSVIYDPELSMDDIKLKVKEWGIEESQELFDDIPKLRQETFRSQMRE